MITATGTITGASVTCEADDLAPSASRTSAGASGYHGVRVATMQRAITGSRHPETSELEALLRVRQQAGRVAKWN